MIGKQESDRCYFCGGKLAPGLVTLPFVLEARVVVVKRVPADICGQCGEAIMTSEVAGTVDGVLKQICRSGFEFSVVAYDELVLTPC